MFFVFEGLDGSGSTTQARLLAQNLEKKGYDVLHTSEPTERTMGKLIRSALQKQWSTSADALQLLFCADRADHLGYEIEPFLSNGGIVVCDRYVWSTIAYGSLGCEVEWLTQLNRNFRIPDHTFLLQVPSSECLRRITSRGADAELFEEQEKLERVWKTFANLQNTGKSPSTVIDGTQSQDQIAAMVLEQVETQFLR